MRTSSRAHRRPEPLYADESYERYAERPSSYRGGHSREYSSISGSKRPHSATVSPIMKFPPILVFLLIFSWV